MRPSVSMRLVSHCFGWTRAAARWVPHQQLQQLPCRLAPVRSFSTTFSLWSDGKIQPKTQGHYTPITRKLWIERLEQAEKHRADAVQQPITHKAPEVTQVIYPFTKDEAFKELYRGPFPGFIRIGCILEDLDSLAGNIAFSHCSRPGFPPPLLVTAAVDEIRLQKPISYERDIRVTGSVVWTGKSALDIQMQLWQEGDCQESPVEGQRPSLVALFSFVHLDPDTKKPAPAVQLLPGTDWEKALAAQRQALADARRSARKVRAEGERIVISPEATNWMKPLLKDARTLVDMPALAATDALPMAATACENIFMTVPQQQNMHGRIFGGFLMRRAYELAFATSYMFAGRRPDFVMVDEISFKRPVDVGNLLHLKSRVLYTRCCADKHLMFVEVDAWVTKPEQCEVANSNTFTFVFSVDLQPGPLKRVLPMNEEEGLRAFECHLAADELLLEEQRRKALA